MRACNYIKCKFCGNEYLDSEICDNCGGKGRTAIVSINLEYHFPLSMSKEEIETELENVILPKEYVENSFYIVNIMENNN